MPFSMDDDFNAQTEIDDLTLDAVYEEELEEEFDWYYELDSDDEDANWSEMSYRRYNGANRWSSLTTEPTEYEEYLLER